LTFGSSRPRQIPLDFQSVQGYRDKYRIQYTYVLMT
jgi:hypothetical protein